MFAIPGVCQKFVHLVWLKKVVCEYFYLMLELFGVRPNARVSP